MTHFLSSIPPVARGVALAAVLAVGAGGAWMAHPRGDVAAAGQAMDTPADPVTGKPPVPMLVELFTSEGCSSCPPADRILDELTHQQPVAGVTVIALEEHVDYWDQLGWRDPFSSARVTARQEAYAHALGLDVYTPQVIIDGRHDALGNDRGDIERTLTRARSEPKARLSVVASAEASGALSVRVGGERKPGAGERVWLAIAEDGLASTPVAGENEGRPLRHTAVVRSFYDAPSGGALEWPATFAVTVDKSWRRDRLLAVAVVQDGSVGRVTAVGMARP